MRMELEKAESSEEWAREGSGRHGGGTDAERKSWVVVGKQELVFSSMPDQSVPMHSSRHP